MEAKNAMVHKWQYCMMAFSVSVEHDNSAKIEYCTFDIFPVLIWLDAIYNFKIELYYTL